MALGVSELCRRGSRRLSSLGSPWPPDLCASPRCSVGWMRRRPARGAVAIIRPAIVRPASGAFRCLRRPFPYLGAALKGGGSLC